MTVNELPPGFGVRRPSGAFERKADSKAAEGRRSPGRCRAGVISTCLANAAIWILGALFSVVAALWSVCPADAQPAVSQAPAVQFRAVDIFVDARDKPLAAYQLEFAVTNGNTKIVGIEGGERPAFAEPPFYDPKAMQHERVILAAFSTKVASDLPSGKTRVATIHLQSRGATEPAFELKLWVAADATGNKIPAEASAEERKAK